MGCSVRAILIYFLRHIKKNCGSGDNLASATCCKSRAWGKQGHATSKVGYGVSKGMPPVKRFFSNFFLCQSNSMEIIQPSHGRGKSNHTQFFGC